MKIPSGWIFRPKVDRKGIKIELEETELILCKDCQYWEKQKDSLQGRCCLLQMYPTGGWYCANAQKKEEEECQS